MLPFMFRASSLATSLRAPSPAAPFYNASSSGHAWPKNGLRCYKRMRMMLPPASKMLPMLVHDASYLMGVGDATSIVQGRYQWWAGLFWRHLVLLPAGFGACEHAPGKVCFFECFYFISFYSTLDWNRGVDWSRAVIGCLHWNLKSKTTRIITLVSYIIFLLFLSLLYYFIVIFFLLGNQEILNF
jgi:hypothetical protein